MALPHLRMIWAPGGPKMTSLLSRFLVTSKFLAEEGTTFDNLKMQNKQVGTQLCTLDHI